ncbi:TraI domain-containing protein [Klebsiella pneumoniae]
MNAFTLLDNQKSRPLPTSQSHHHSTPGGLLDHSLTNWSQQGIQTSPANSITPRKFSTRPLS